MSQGPLIPPPYPPQPYAPAQYAYGQPPIAYSPPPSALPKPPRLHWGWVLGLNVVTRGLFLVVWLIVQANWVRKVRGRSTAFVWSILHAAFYPLIFFVALIAGFAGGAAGISHDEMNLLVAIVGLISAIGILTLYCFTTFTLRSELQKEPIALPLGGLMTFFFSAIYFQYFLRDWGTPLERSGTLNLSQPKYPLSGAAAQPQPQVWPPPPQA